MELIQLLFKSLKGEMCFLCYKRSVNTENIRSKLEVKSETVDKTLSLAEMVMSLFPSFEPTLTEACEVCADLIIRMYVTIQQNSFTSRVINSIIDAINKQISNTDDFSVYDKLDIELNIAKIIEDTKQIKENLHKYNHYDTLDENYEEVINISKSFDGNSSHENQCPNCFKMFECVKKFKAHMKNHNRRRKKAYYSHCTHCDYRTQSKQTLQGHINRRHLKVKPHVCNTCYKNFYHKRNLVEHQKIHLQVRNEVCEVCGDTFVHKKNLLEHLKLHSGERPYLCEICDQRFITSGRRLEHIKRCHSDKKECCLLCEKKFSLLKELTRHIKTVHT